MNSFMNSFIAHWTAWFLPVAVQAAIVGLVAVLCLRLVPRSPSWFHLGVLLIALLKFAVPPVVDSQTGLFSWLGRAELNVPGQIGVAGIAEMESPAPFFFSRVFPRMPLSLFGDEGEAGLADPKASPATPPITREAGSSTPPSWLSIAFAIQLGGGLWFAGLWYRRARALGAIRRRALAAEGALLARFNAAKAHVGAPSIELFLSDEVDQPICFGVSRPTVILPRHTAERHLGSDLDAVLAHEALHLRHRDPIVHHIASALAVVWWFHPVFWLVRRELVKVQEDRADDGLLALRVASPEDYCQSLLEIAGQTRSATPALASGALQHPLARRFRRLLDPHWKPKGNHPMSYALTLVFVPMIALPGAPLEPEPPAASAAYEAVVATDSDTDPVEPRQLAISRGLQWLASQQRENGRFGTAEAEIAPRDEALALLAFLGAGNTTESGPHQDTVKRGIESLAARIDAGHTPAGTVDLPLATLAIVESFLLSGDENQRGVAERAIARLVEAAPAADCDGAVAFWSVLAATSALDAGLGIAPARVAQDLTNLIHRATDKQGANFVPRRPRSLDAAALFAGYLSSHSVEETVAQQVGSTSDLVDQLLKGGVEGVAAEEDTHFIAYAAFQAGGEAWERFRTNAVQPIADGQVVEGSAIGSWSGPDASSELRRTAMNTMTLEVFYRYARLMK